MGLMDSWKAKLAPAKDKVSGLAQQHGGKIESGLDKAAKMVDEKTKGKYSDKIQTGTGKAKDAMDRLAHQGDTGSAGNTGTESGGTTTPPDSPPPTS
ncbi:antitoxin [Streptomyces sp. NRRL F-525]|uniref:antitoxin n=1 Tax=Streptomyces sp. NRRL F-525 TaxID=1463861 RepID=UPI000523F99C|nr:antitoxin [Streptomyces sp. NRRL F-525]